MTASQVEFPSSVETLITSRIDRLPVGDQLILKVLDCPLIAPDCLWETS
jgi:hypothetical protein